MFHNSYLKHERIWEEETDVRAPRKVCPRLSALFVFLAIMGLIGLLLEAAAYFVNAALIQNGKWNAEYLALALFILLGCLIFKVALKEGRSARNWTRVIGKVDIITKSIGRTQGRTYGIGYELNRDYFRVNISEEAAGLTHSEVGDPVVLLVDPQDPNSALSYGGLSWRVIKLGR